jgi:tryptophan-rich sensory protein
MRISPTLVRTSAAVTATAVIGGLGTDVTSHWYRDLDKPRWQPPGAAFGPAWTTLYGLTAVASARILDRLETPEERRAFANALGANLALNAGWNWLFFKARRPRWALGEILLMEVSTLDLTRRAAKVDSPAAKMLIPYAGWVAFATLLNASIARRNPKAHQAGQSR